MPINKRIFCDIFTLFNNRHYESKRVVTAIIHPLPFILPFSDLGFDMKQSTLGIFCYHLGRDFGSLSSSERVFFKSLDFYGFNSLKVMLFMESIPKKSCFWGGDESMYFCTILTME